MQQDILTFLEEEGVDRGLLEAVRAFRAKFPTEAENAARVPAPQGIPNRHCCHAVENPAGGMGSVTPEPFTADPPD